MAPRSSSPTSIPFPLYLIPSIPFRRRRRRRQSSLSTTTTPSTPSTSPSSSPPTNAPTYLAHTSTSYLQCHKCLTDLLPTTSIISKGFTGRHGRAYLVAPPLSTPTTPSSTHNVLPGDLPNVHTHKPVPRQLVTGAHTVSDISCRQCGSVLGWKYVAAEEESQRYKVGKFILETKRVVRGVVWEGWDDDGRSKAVTAQEDDDHHHNHDHDHDDDMEFDSQDEDECEDLFSGIWSKGLARRRRANRGFGRDD
ncbi:yippee-domain-containing protein [Pleomassaria siparia CBS 279.74]|uniref:Yippee-domain-containing protein n=1 Tax=Pleomassaria siparia CBS 279.74 TaxID=1314801 RepID=A0A6G1KEM3_9PLEO|nr:yippee-domain-containing protein [Pleomassaria siparia CBS 279.74]